MGVIVELARARTRITLLEAQLVELQKQIPVGGVIGINEMSSIILDKLDEMRDDKAELYLADKLCKVHKKADVVRFLGLDETDKIVYSEDDFDCDDYAAVLYGKGLGLLWTSVHALCWFIDENNVLWFLEPQTDVISQVLDDWQGWDCRFFLSR